MRGVKVAAGVFAILEGIVGLVGGILVAVFGSVKLDMLLDVITGLNLDFVNDTLAQVDNILKTIFIVAGVIVAVFGFVFFLLGCRTCKRKSGKGTVAALFVFSILLMNPLVFILALVYLIGGGNENQSGNY